MDAAYERFDFSVGINAAMDAVREANRLFTAGAPWKACGSADRVDALVYIAFETCRVAAGLLEPVLPTSARELLWRLNAVDSGLRSTEETAAALAGKRLNVSLSPLFPKSKAPKKEAGCKA